MADVLTKPKIWNRMHLWVRRGGLSRLLAIGLIFGALGSGVASYVVITRDPSSQPDSGLIFDFLQLNLVFLFFLTLMVGWRLYHLWRQRRRGLAGSRLHLRLVFLFTVVTVVPMVIVALFSTLWIESWFNERVSTAINESQAVAQAYLKEHQQLIRADLLAMANDIDRQAEELLSNPEMFQEVVEAQTSLRSLAEARVFDLTARTLAKSRLAFLLEIEPIPPQALRQAQLGEAVVFTNESDNRVRALVKLHRVPGGFLYVGRFVDPEVIAHIESTQEAVDAYHVWEDERYGLEVTFSLMFFSVAMLLVLSAVWVGLGIANQLVTPIGKLIMAAERVRGGDLDVQVDTPDMARDEIHSLTHAFNRMTEQLRAQRSDLVRANRQLDQRRMFTEAVLEGVSAGVVGLDAHGKIQYPNKAASDILGLSFEEYRGQKLDEVEPSFKPVMELAMQQSSRLIQQQITVQGRGAPLNLLVQVSAEIDQKTDETKGYVVTFDDITQLMQAQRTAAWADVARRMAHEIKNPLTPIQLSAERLKRKYLQQIKEDPETFKACTDTIIRHVEDLGSMVNEFSAFARMPEADLRQDDVKELCQEAVSLHRHGYPDIAWRSELPDGKVLLNCDVRQLRQALTNLLKNAAESIEGREVADSKAPKGEVVLRLLQYADQTMIEIMDNGKGLPTEDREKLTEPYITTREKGTGIGLAVVRKIMQDHGAVLELMDREDHEQGAVVRIVFTQGAHAQQKVGGL